MCSWETYATFAREPEYRRVDDNSRITLDHQVYRVTGELRGERVEVWKGVFDTGIYIQDKESALASTICARRRFTNLSVFCPKTTAR